ASACIGGTNNDEIFIFDGHCYDNYFIKKLDTNKQQWVNITSTECVPENRTSISCAKFSNNFIAIFIGNITLDTSNILIFNTLSLSWSLSIASKMCYHLGMVILQ
ncbi:33510_t:CDS:1, partial [Gigaspora margarita]